MGLFTCLSAFGGGGNLMVWGSMGWNGVGVLTGVEGIMNAIQYCEILDAGAVESFEKLRLQAPY